LTRRLAVGAAGSWIDNLHAAASTFALILVGLHIGGVIFASIEHGENLVRAMISGMKRAP
jgi:cytochrome b